MFLIFLAIFTLILTVFENIFLAFWVLIITLIIYFLRQKLNKSTESENPHSRPRWIVKHKVMFLIIWAFILSLTSILIKNHTYTQKVDSISTATGLISQNMDWPQWFYFVGTGIVSDIYSYQRFIFQDNSDREYFLNSSNNYKIWDVIRLNWYVSPGYTWSKNIFDLKQQCQSLSQKPNLSWLFTYEFDYPKRLMMKWFYWTIYEQNSVISTKTGAIQISFLQKIRKNLQKNIIQAYGENPQAGLILGMLVWDRSQIPPDEYDWFIDSWLVHIIAVSGWNIIMIVVFLGAVLFFLPFYVRNAVILATIILYAMICGMDSSVFRATIMWWLWMLALFWWREVNIRRAMSIAFIVMLVINPYFLAYDVWFLLSFSAIIGIVYFGKWVAPDLDDVTNHPSTIEQTPPLSGRISQKLIILPDKGGCSVKLGGFVTIRVCLNKIFKSKFLQKITKEYITPTIWATLWVLPVMLFFMGKTNLTWIIANFLVVPIIAIVMIYGFVSTMLFQLFPREFILRPEKMLTQYIYFISDLAWNRWVYLQAEWSWIKYALLILFAIWFVSERLRKCVDTPKS